MPYNFTYYVSIKNKCCISYFGPNTEYIAQIKIIRPLIQEVYPELEIWLSCNDNLLHFLNDEQNIMSRTKLVSNKRQFGHIDEIRHGFDKTQPIEKYLKNIEVNLKPISLESNTISNICIVADQCDAPNKKLNYDDVIKHIRSKGFIIKEFSNLKDLESCGWVVGVENAITYLAASKGIKTTLVPTGIGTVLFKTLFPKSEVFCV